MITIREARKDEIPQLQLLNKEALAANETYDADAIPDWGITEYGKTFFTNLLNTPTSCCFVAEIDGTLVGYIGASEKIVTYRKSKYVEIDNIGIIPAYCSQGIGSMLITACKQWAKEKGYQKIYVNAYIANSKAIAFYEKHGFTKIDVSLETFI